MDIVQPHTTTWQQALGEEKEKDYFLEIILKINEMRRKGLHIYPSKENTFNAIKMTPLDKVRVVIIGQDPYHGPGQAHGLCFSVLPGVPHPPSLQNIFKEIQRDLGFFPPKNGCLTPWAQQGVLLLNTVLTVEHKKAHSHANLGWEKFTDKIIETVNNHCSNVVFLLWGSHAQKKTAYIDEKQHYCLKSTHPSPLSAHRGFLGCGHFSQTNQLLIKHGHSPIHWELR